MIRIGEARIAHLAQGILQELQAKGFEIVKRRT
jgi:hypothetical protein